MRARSFLFLLFVCFNSISVHPLTVVLKNGKTIEGDLIAQSDRALQVKTRDGIVISIKKDNVANLITSASERPAHPTEQIAASPTEKKISLVDLANETKKNRSGNARVVTDRDISELPEISFLGTNVEPSKTVKDAPPEKEEYWRSAAQVLKRKLDSAHEKRSEAVSDCTEARNQAVSRPAKRHKNEILVMQAAGEPPECRKLQQRELDLQDAQQEWDDFVERARHAEVPWLWID